MSEPIFKADLKIISSGLMLGLHDADPPLWFEAININFDSYGASSMKGASDISVQSTLWDDLAGNWDDLVGNWDDLSGALTAMQVISDLPITGLLQQLKSNSVIQFVAGTKTNLYSFTGGSTTSVGSGYTGYDDETPQKNATRWSMAPFGDWVLATNGIQQIQIMKTSSFANLTGPLFTWADIIKVIGPHLVAFNTSNGPTMMEWCAEDDPEQWDRQINPTAGDLPIRQLESPIKAVEELGQSLIAYTANEAQRVDYVGGVFILGSKKAVQGIGAVSKNAIIPVGSLQYGLMHEGIFSTDGLSFKWISYPAFGHWLEENINWNQKTKIAGYHNRALGQVKWSVPLVGSNENNHTITYNYLTGGFGKSDLAFNVGLEAAVMRYPLIGRSIGRVKMADSSRSDSGVAIKKKLVTKPLDCGQRDRWKFLDYVQVQMKITAGSGPQLYVGWQDSLDGVVTWLGPYTLGSKVNTIPVMQSGVFLTLRFESENVQDDWLLSGFTLFGDDAGGER